MIEIKVDAPELKEVEKQLGDLENQAPKAIKTAVNKTSKEAQKLLLSKAKQTYAVKNAAFTGKSDSALRIQKASMSRLYATLHSEGSPIDLYKFKVSPARYTTGDNRPDSTRAHVLAKNPFKNLLVENRWAFIVRFKNGHITVAERRGKERYPIDSLYSLAIPQMIGSEKYVYGEAEQKIQELLAKHVEEEIARIKGGG